MRRSNIVSKTIVDRIGRNQGNIGPSLSRDEDIIGRKPARPSRPSQQPVAKEPIERDSTTSVSFVEQRYLDDMVERAKKINNQEEFQLFVKTVLQEIQTTGFNSKSTLDKASNLLKGIAQEKNFLVRGQKITGSYQINKYTFLFDNGSLKTINRIPVQSNLSFVLDDNIIYVDDKDVLRIFVNTPQYKTLTDSVDHSEKIDKESSIKDLIGTKSRFIEATKPVDTAREDISHIYSNNFVPYNLIEKVAPILLLGTGLTLFFLVLQQTTNEEEE